MKIIDTVKSNPSLFLIPLILLLAGILRITGINFGLPGTYLPDEPHHINTALYFGSGTLRPPAFKYPTLWMYLLSISFGITFLIWSGGGILKSVADFAHLFVWDPSLIYLVARGLNVLLALSALGIVVRIGKRWKIERVGIYAAYLLAICPPLISFGHQAKADFLMMFFCALLYLKATDYLLTGHNKHLFLAGLFLGLAISSQYTALLLVPLIPWIVVLRKTTTLSTGLKSLTRRELWIALGIVLGGFLAGTPYALLDIHTFLADFSDLLNYGAGGLARAPMKLGFGVLHQYTQVMGSFVGGMLFLIIGVSFSLKHHRRFLLFIGGPILWAGIVMSQQDRQAGVINYLFSVFPLIALAMGLSLEVFSRWKIPSRGVLAIAFVVSLPSLWSSIQIDRDYLAPDTRTLAKHWIEKNIPAGSRLLMDQLYASPPLIMSRNQVDRIVRKTKALGHPRYLFYTLMQESHPGGGYEIFRIQRTPKELVSGQRLITWSQQGYELIHVENGLPALKEKGIQYVITSNLGATAENSPRLKIFFDDLNTQCKLLKAWVPTHQGLSPTLKLYQIPST